ncbi:enoyl-CoA hydratase/isomerase family protein [Cupriavidus pauculus]|uniref:Enoyl-CoA hydratase/isomerase family protein n=1 Tax=Cupriavidus pauculus TaxID=82633 RepID=A0A5P2HC76_9BURK|nr:enoyl-CoA hydratase-related protein [Cupriavidus pauculus]QET05073.1 enoyl-CoA hydratase/isomerase family protein [Cupriavidus pauculus]
MRQPILTEREGQIATVTLNNPEKLNALDLGMWQGLTETMTALSADDSVRCVVLRGAGDKAFAAGADIEEFRTRRFTRDQAREYGEITHATMRAIQDCRHPTIALIQGACVGGGLEIASMCDLRICGQSSRFGVPVNRLGLVMSYGELGGLMALTGPAAAIEIVLEGRVFDAAEAREKGLVTRIVADADVPEEAYAAARRIAQGAPLVARWHKQFVRRLLDPTPLRPEEADEAYACFDTQDFHIGFEAFVGKTKPQFSGR